MVKTCLNNLVFKLTNQKQQVLHQVKPLKTCQKDDDDDVMCIL